VPTAKGQIPLSVCNALFFLLVFTYFTFTVRWYLTHASPEVCSEYLVSKSAYLMLLTTTKL